jgi:hypothetical protein
VLRVLNNAERDVHAVDVPLERLALACPQLHLLSRHAGSPAAPSAPTWSRRVLLAAAPLDRPPLLHPAVPWLWRRSPLPPAGRQDRKGQRPTDNETSWLANRVELGDWQAQAPEAAWVSRRRSSGTRLGCHGGPPTGWGGGGGGSCTTGAPEVPRLGRLAVTAALPCKPAVRACGARSPDHAGSAASAGSEAWPRKASSGIRGDRPRASPTASTVWSRGPNVGGQCQQRDWGS